MEPYQLRVVEEKEALDEKINRLARFLKSSTCSSTVDDEELARLDEQLSHMNQYSRVLGDRISHFV